jgi:hypothetical protein
MSEALVILVVEEVFYQPFKHIVKGRYRYVRMNGSSKSERPEHIVTSNAGSWCLGLRHFWCRPCCGCISVLQEGAFAVNFILFRVSETFSQASLPDEVTGPSWLIASIHGCS